MQEAGIPCPKVVCLRKHILVMTFVGADQKPAPKLKDAILSRSELESAYKQCTEVKCFPVSKLFIEPADFAFSQLQLS